MCECGCSTSGKFWKLPGPCDNLYRIQQYPGCENCVNPIGVGIDLVRKDDPDYGELVYSEEIILNKENCYMAGIPFFSEEHLRKRFIEFCEYVDTFPLRDEHDLDIVFEDFLTKFYYTMSEWDVPKKC